MKFNILSEIIKRISILALTVYHSGTGKRLSRNIAGHCISASTRVVIVLLSFLSLLLPYSVKYAINTRIKRAI